MCLLKTNTVPVVVGALGLIKKGTQEQSNNIPDALSLQGIKSNNSKMNNPYAKSFVHLSFFFSVHSCLLFKWPRQKILSYTCPGSLVMSRHVIRKQMQVQNYTDQLLTFPCFRLSDLCTRFNG